MGKKVKRSLYAVLIDSRYFYYDLGYPTYIVLAEDERDAMNHVLQYRNREYNQQTLGKSYVALLSRNAVVQKPGVVFQHSNPAGIDGEVYSPEWFRKMGKKFGQ